MLVVAYAFFVGMACLESTWHLLSDQGPLWECMVSALVWVYWGAPGDTVKSAFGRCRRNRQQALCLGRRQVRPDGQQVHKLLLLASALVDLLTAVAQPQPLGRWHAAVDPGGVCHLGKQASNQAQVVPLLLSVAVVAAAKVEDHHDRKHRKLLCKQAYTCTNLLRKHSNRVCN